MYLNMLKKKRHFCIIIIILPVYWLYINIHLFRIVPQKPKRDLSKFDVREYTYPLTFNIREVIESYLRDNRSLPSQSINPHPYRYLYSPFPCNFTHLTKPYILALVKSFAGSIEQRKVLRQLASNVTISNIKLVFMLATADQYVDSIFQENKTYGDLIQESFIDAYSNNTLKTIMGFRWASEYCPDAQLLLFLDDDYFVKWNKMVEFLHRFKNNHTNLFFGKRVSSAVPYRDQGSPWYLDTKVYPFKTYPPYLAGGVYVVSRDVSRKFNLAFPFVKYIGVDDAYLGLVANILGVTPTHCTEMSRKDHLSVAVECSHNPSELKSTKCHTHPQIPIELFITEVESVLGKFIGLLINVIGMIKKILLIFQYVVTFGQH